MIKNGEIVMNDLYVHQLETENKQLREALQQTRKVLEEQARIIENAINCINWHYDLGTKEDTAFCWLRDNLLKILGENNDK